MVEIDYKNLEKMKPVKSFEEGWAKLQTVVDRLSNQGEGVIDPGFRMEHSILCYTVVYQVCGLDKLGCNENTKRLYAQYKKVFEEYASSTVLPYLQGKKGELLLGELLRTWSIFKDVTKWFIEFFEYLERYYIPGRKLPSLGYTSFLTFHDLVHDKIKTQVADAVAAMIDQERAGEKIDETLVGNTLAMYSEIGDILTKNNFGKKLTEELIEEYDRGGPPIQFRRFLSKEGELPDIPTPSSKKIWLVSSDGDVFEVDYGMAHESKTVEDVVKNKPAGGTDHNILVYLVSSGILAKVIEYCKKHTEAASNSTNKEDMSGFDIKDWDSKFVDIDSQTLVDLHLCANLLNIKSLRDLTYTGIGDMIKWTAPDVTRQMFFSH